MKASVSQQSLAHGLSMVSRAVSPRSTLPVLANVLIATDEGRLRLSATNLELGISCWIPAQIEEEGAITVPARTFSDYVNTLSGERVQLTANMQTQSLNVRSAASTSDIKGIDANEYPPMPAPDLANGVTFKAGELKEMIQQVAFAASTDEARPVLQGVMVSLRDGELTLAATDGFRISVRRAPLAASLAKPLEMIVPARALTELARIAADPEAEIRLHIPSGRGQAIFRLKDAELVTQLIEGNFPDYRAIIPRALKTHTILTTAALLAACKQAEIIAREGNNVIRVDVRGRGQEPGVVEISAQSEETGNSEVQLDANIDGPDLTIAFNVRYLREVLDVIKTPSVALETIAHNAPAVVRPVGDENFVHVIMPIHLG